MTWFDKFMFIDVEGSGMIKASHLKRATWNLKFALTPQRCVHTGKLIWFTRAYRGVLIISRPENLVCLTYWLTPSEFVIKSLKGELNGH